MSILTFLKGIVNSVIYDYPDSNKVLGLDCSHWAGGVIDFAKAKTNGIRFVYVKAKDGLVTSNWFVENWQASKEAEILRGAYHWLYPSNKISVKTQAQELYYLLESDMGELPVAVDFEWTYWGGSPANPSASDLYGFIENWKQITDKEILIYTAPGYWNQYGNTDSYWKQYKLWIANYYVTNPSIPLPWTNYEFHQWTDKGYGIDYGFDQYQQKAVDLNYFYGTNEQLTQKYGGVVVEPPIPPVEPPTTPGDTMGKIPCTNGAIIEKFVEYGSEILAFTVPPTTMEFPSWYYTPGEGHLAEELVNNELKVFWNFTPYVPATGIVNVGLTINGQQKHEHVGTQPWIEWNDQNYPIIRHTVNLWKNVHNGSQGNRYIIENFSKNSAAVIDPSRPEWNSRDARTIVANDTNGRTIILISKGDDQKGDGLTLHEWADILLNWVKNGHGDSDIYYALDGDSGSSSHIAYILNGEKVVVSGYPLDERNHPVAFGYFKLKEPLITDTTPVPEPEPEPDLPDYPFPSAYDVDSPEGYKPETKRYVPEN